MYDTSVRQTFASLDTWRQEIDTYVTKQNAVRMLVGNKIDKVSFSDQLYVSFSNDADV